MALFSSPLSYLLGLLAWLVMLGWLLRSLLTFRRRRRTARKSSRLLDFSLAGWMLLAVLTGIELAVAAFYDESDSFDLTNVSKRWFSRHVRLNSQGFRDTEPFTRLVPEGKQRIVFIGDSFTFGHGVKRIADRFSDRVADGLNQAQPGKYIVANLGRSGIGANDLVPLWTQAVVEPDAHVDLAYYVLCLNDIEWFTRNNHARYTQISSGAPQWFPFRQTYAYNLLYYRYRQLTSPQIVGYYSDLREHYQGAAWTLMAEELDRFHTLLTEAGTELRIVIFPFLHNLGHDYPFREAHARIKSYATKRGLICVDLEPVLSPHATETLTVNRFDAHPNPTAQRYAAEAILADILRQPPVQPTRSWESSRKSPSE